MHLPCRTTDVSDCLLCDTISNIQNTVMLWVPCRTQLYRIWPLWKPFLKGGGLFSSNGEITHLEKGAVSQQRGYGASLPLWDCRKESLQALSGHEWYCGVTPQGQQLSCGVSPHRAWSPASATSSGHDFSWGGSLVSGKSPVAVFQWDTVLCTQLLRGLPLIYSPRSI